MDSNLHTRNTTLHNHFKIIPPKTFIKSIYGNNPIHLRSKYPINDSQCIATTDADRIFEYANNPDTWAVMGYFSPHTDRATKDTLLKTPALVIDFDNIPAESLDNLIKYHKELPINYIVSTGGGIHVYTHLKVPSDVAYLPLLTKLRNKLATIISEKIKADYDKQVSITHALRMPGFPVKLKYSSMTAATAYMLNPVRYSVKQLQEILNTNEPCQEGWCQRGLRSSLQKPEKPEKHDPDSQLKNIQTKMPKYIFNAYFMRISAQVKHQGHRNQLFTLLGALTTKIKIKFKEALKYLKTAYKYVLDKTTFDEEEALTAFTSGRYYIHYTAETISEILLITRRTKKNISSKIKNKIYSILYNSIVNSEVISYRSIKKSTGYDMKTVTKYISIIKNETLQNKETFYYINDYTMKNSKSLHDAIQQKLRDDNKLPRQNTVDTLVKPVSVQNSDCNDTEYKQVQSTENGVIQSTEIPSGIESGSSRLYIKKSISVKILEKIEKKTDEKIVKRRAKIEKKLC